MSPEREAFEQLVLACLETPDDTDLRARRDALLAAHPEWAADREEIEALWRAAHLVAPGRDEITVDDAPELSAELEARLMAQHAPAKPRLRPLHLFALAASVVVLLNIALQVGPRLGYLGDTAFDQDGRRVMVWSKKAVLVRHEGQWEQVAPFPDDLSEGRLAALDHLVNPGRPLAASTATRGPDQRVEFWAPLDGEIGMYSPIQYYSVDGAAVRLELRSPLQEKIIWQTDVPAGPPGPRVIKLPRDIDRRRQELILTPLDNPLQQLRIDFSYAGPNGANVFPVRPGSNPSLQFFPSAGDEEAIAAEGAFMLLGRRILPADTIIEAFLPLAPESLAARQTLRAVAAAYELPYLAAYVDELSAAAP